MTRKVLFWFCLLVLGFLVWPGLAQIPEPAQCLVSGNYKLVRAPYRTSHKCWKDCSEEVNCDMAVVIKPLGSFEQCLLVNCKNQGTFSHRRDPSTQISVYPKNNGDDDDQRKYLKEGAYGLANEILKCYKPPNNQRCQSEVHRFFYNSSSFTCERHSDCSSRRNGFDTQEGCEALCNEKFRCYRPVQFGPCRAEMSKFFFNVSSQRCERFTFSGCGSNGNVFSSEEECQSLCGGVKATTTSQPAVFTVSDATETFPAKTTDNSQINITDFKPATSSSPPPEDSATTTSQPAVVTVSDATDTFPAKTTATTTSQPAVVTDDTVGAPAHTLPTKTTESKQLTSVSRPALESDMKTSVLKLKAIRFVVLPLGVLLIVVFVKKCHRRFRRSPVARWQVLPDHV